jgi:hypothetical protein
MMGLVAMYICQLVFLAILFVHHPRFADVKVGVRAGLISLYAVYSALAAA